MWKICFEDNTKKVVDEIEFTSFRQAREFFDKLVLNDFAKAVLIRKDGTFLALKEKSC